MIERIGSISRHERLIGDIRGTEPGPTIVCVGAVHGNEPAGVLALERVLTSLRREDGLGRGRFIAVIGNLGALNQGRRYIDLDLNRLWWPRLVMTAVAADEVPLGHEEWEKTQLQELLSAVFGDAPQEHYMVDLHTTSSLSPPFSIAGCSDSCRQFAELFELPVVLGLEEKLGNTLIDYFIDRGWTAAALEAGQHQDPNSIDVHESLLWRMLQQLGCVTGTLPQRVLEARQGMRQASDRAPRTVRVLYRHPVRPGGQLSHGRWIPESSGRPGGRGAGS